MPDHWTGTLEDRYERLEQEQRRCDGNNRRCTHRAVKRYLLAPAREFILIPGREQETKQSCSRHVQQFVNNPNYAVVESKNVSAGQPQRHPNG